MPAPSINPGELDELVLQVRDLQQRVLKLEELLAIRTEPAKTPAPAAATAFDLPSNPIPVLGRMLLAIAGAYVLRALTDWGVLPAAAGVAIGLVYALVWLWLATRAPLEAKFQAAVNGFTSMLIMAPLVWEASGRLKAMSSGTSAAILAGFALIALWRG